jgi:hypothetical protein
MSPLNKKINTMSKPNLLQNGGIVAGEYRLPKLKKHPNPILIEPVHIQEQIKQSSILVMLNILFP